MCTWFGIYNSSDALLITFAAFLSLSLSAVVIRSFNLFFFCSSSSSSSYFSCCYCRCCYSTYSPCISWTMFDKLRQAVQASYNIPIYHRGKSNHTSLWVGNCSSNILSRHLPTSLFLLPLCMCTRVCVRGCFFCTHRSHIPCDTNDVLQCVELCGIPTTRKKNRHTATKEAARPSSRRERERERDKKKRKQQTLLYFHFAN